MMIEFGDPRMPERFWSKVRVLESGCWEWRACIGAGSYGRYGTGGRSKAGYAHRVAYEVMVSPLAPDMKLDHMCHTRDKTCPGGLGCMHRRCVNPEHLEPVTNRINALRGRGPSAIHAAQTECIHGHPFDAVNTKYRLYQDKSGKSHVRRDCRTCQANGYWRRRNATSSV